MESNEKFTICTKMMNKVIFVVLCLLFVQCRMLPEKEGENSTSLKSNADFYIERTRDYLLTYESVKILGVDSDPSKWRDASALLQKQRNAFDSLVYFIDKGLEEFPNHTGLVFQKIYVLLEQHRYDEAIGYLQNDCVFIVGVLNYPYKEILKNRFNAMKCISANDMKCRDLYLRKALQLVENYIVEHKTTIEESMAKDMYKLDESIPYATPILQYYIYSVPLFGEKETLRQLQRLVQISDLQYLINLIQPYDFMKFSGL